MLETLDILRWTLIARWLDALRSRAALESHQERWLRRLRRDVLPRSPFYAPLARTPYEAWPVMSKGDWMGAFDRINTRGITLHEALGVAERAECSRDFSPTLNGVAVGLSTGTSGRRGLFLVSPAERRRWAGLMLAKLFPRPVTAPCRVAFFLRANSPLYQGVDGAGRIDFRFFDLLTPLEDSAAALGAFRPDVLIAPPSVLTLLARAQRRGDLALDLARVVSVAEVLHPDDRAAVEDAFGPRLDEVYQATEGCLAITCEEGRLHLNEAFVKIEPRWIDRSAGRFSPIVTDLTRGAQPVVRYLLDDVLVAAPEPCPCGRAAMTLTAVEGRADEVCSFVHADGSKVRVFPDFLARAILGAAPEAADFRVVELAPGRFSLQLQDAAPDAPSRVTRALSALAARLDAEPPQVVTSPWSPPTGSKRRRISKARCEGD